MSVYTKVSAQELERFLNRYSLGKATRFVPIEPGITNSNYYLDTERGYFVLTLYEHHDDDELAYMLGLQRHLVDQGIRCAAPVADRRGDLFSTLNQRPAAVITRLDGRVAAPPDEEHCRAIGAELAEFHIAGQGFAGTRTNPRGLGWLLATGDMLQENLSAEDRGLIDETLDEYRAFDSANLPYGAIHADLFHDNALFVGHRLVGIIDFDYACTDIFAFDLAVALNDWCIDDNGELETARAGALLDAYQQRRRLTPAELDVLPLLLRVTALRFWLSRLYDKLFPLAGELTYYKDPNEFRTILQRRRQAQLDKLLHARRAD